jgi:RNA 2',3'-cyclic 3'-phosphodiesterase
MGGVRLFVAVYPSPAAVAHLSAAVAGLRLGAATARGHTVGLTATARWHLTLAFLGEVPEPRVPVAKEALASGVARWRTERADQAGHAPPPRLWLAGAGRFGRRRFTVLWVGLSGDVDALRSLGRAVRRELRRSGVPFDGKPLRPHLTFARPGDRVPAEHLAADLAALARYEGPAWTVEEVHLVRSHLGPKPVHETLAVTPTG